MKRYIQNLAIGALILAGAVATGCSTIDEDERFIPVEAPEVACRVLLFDFTGQNCTNCPAAHRVLEKLDRLYGEDLITVAIHAGSFGIADGGPDAKRVGLKQPDGDELANHWKIDAYPAGVINGNGPFESDKWATQVAEAIVNETPVELAATADVTPEGNVTAYVEAYTSESFTGTVAAWVVENGIIARQNDNGTLIQDYTHNHVFRCPMGELYGASVNLAPRDTYTATLSAPTSEHPHWNTDNMDVVVFAMDKDGKIVQSLKVPVGTPQWN